MSCVKEEAGLSPLHSKGLRHPSFLNTLWRLWMNGEVPPFSSQIKEGFFPASEFIHSFRVDPNEIDSLFSPLSLIENGEIGSIFSPPFLFL